MTYFENNPGDYIRTVAEQVGGRIFYGGFPDNLELPNPNNFDDRDMVVHYDGVYIKQNNEWVKILDNLRAYTPSVFNSTLQVKEKNGIEKEEKTDTTPWLALLEE